MGLSTIELFAGAGGGALGGLLLGHRPNCYVEREPYCQQVLEQRIRDGILPDAPIWDDVRTFDGLQWRDCVDAVCGGFPCQDISIAGKGKGISGSRSGLWGQMARIICEVEPRYVFVENSPMLTNRGLDRVLGDLAQMGFDAEWCVLGARDVGAPHRRNRIWLLAAHPYRNELRKQPRRSGREGGEGSAQPSIDGKERGLAYSNEIGRSRRARGQSPGRRQPSNGCRDVADADQKRCQKRDLTAVGDQLGQPAGGIASTWWRRDPATGPAQSRVGRLADGVANRVDRIKALGNGQVPAVAALAWRVLERRLNGRL